MTRTRCSIRFLSVVLVCLILDSCGLPEFAPGLDGSKGPASGPTVAALIENLKCQLWDAAHDENPLSYDELTSIRLNRPITDTEENFSVKNILAEIEYIASVKLSLEVTNTAALNPSLNLITPYSAASTSLTLAVGGQLSDAAHRNMNIDESVDFARFVPSLPINPRFLSNKPSGKNNAAPGTIFSPYLEDPKDLLIMDPKKPCTSGFDLTGDLGLREVMQTALLSAKLEDFGVRLRSDGTAKAGQIDGQTPIIQQFDGFAFGVVDTQIDFTITTNLNGGPNWTLKEFKGPIATNAPGGLGQGLLNLNRVYKDTLLITISPVCIRQKYFPKSWNKYAFEGREPGGAQNRVIANEPVAKPDSLLAGHRQAVIKDISPGSTINLEAAETALNKAIEEYITAKGHGPADENAGSTAAAEKANADAELDHARAGIEAAAEKLDALENKPVTPATSPASKNKSDAKTLRQALADLDTAISGYKAAAVNRDQAEKNVKAANAVDPVYLARAKLQRAAAAVDALKKASAPGSAPPKSASLPLKFPVEYDEPALVAGTPEWAHYLPSCTSPEGVSAKLRAGFGNVSGNQATSIANMLSSSMRRY